MDIINQSYLAVMLSRLGIIVLAMLIDTTAGVTLALWRREFQWQKLTAFMQEGAVYLIFYVLSELLILIPAEIDIEFLGQALPVVGYGVYLLTAGHYVIEFLLKLQTLQIFKKE